MKSLLASLESLGLNKAEALVYVDILKNPDVNGSQITKRVDLPKPSVYLAVDKLYQRGLINLIPGKSKQYRAQDPLIALEKLRHDFNSQLDSVLNEIQQLQITPPVDEFIHITGYANFLAQLEKMLARTKKELYIHTNVDLNLFAEVLRKLIDRNIRVIVYSFGRKYTYDFTLEEYYDSNKPLCDAFSFMVVSDYQECVMSCGKPDEEYLGIYTRQELQIQLIAENIHNAIYWLKLYQQHPDFDYPCRLETLAEKDIYPSGYSI